MFLESVQNVFKMKLKLVLISFFISCMVFSQTSGVVINLEGDPIENVSVYIADQDIITYTNYLGQFSFSNTIPENSFFEFKKYGYSTKLHKHAGGKINITYLGDMTGALIIE